MATWLWIVIVIVVVAIALVAAVAARRRRTMALRQRFGAEYDRAVDAREGQRAAEADLRGRERERARLDIKPLSEASRVRYTEEWRGIQQSFVDQPEGATAAAYDLVNSVMAERGYPMRDFDARADLVSVDHPDVVENYRVAHNIHERAQHQQATTEDLREALVRYRSLFEELLRADDHAAAPADAESASPEPASTRPADAEPVSTRAADAEAVSPEPASARPADAEPAGTEPARPAGDQPAARQSARSKNAVDVEARDDRG